MNRSAWRSASKAAREETFAPRLVYGMVSIITGLISNEAAPFGGVAQWGLGREGFRDGIEGDVVVKYLCLGQMD